MKIEKTHLIDAYRITTENHSDHRGQFSRLWCLREFEAAEIDFKPAQLNYGHSLKEGTIRGLHYQEAPHMEAKVITCTEGEIFDVMIDLRPESSTFLKWQGLRISAEEKQLLYIPKGFAHGYQALIDHCSVIYFVDEFYTPGSESGIRWDDPFFNIEWPVTENVILSDKDSGWQNFKSPAS